MENLIRISLVIVKLLLTCRAGVARNVAIADLHWDGVSAFIVVDGKAVQDRLDKYHNKRFGKFGNQARQLYVPQKSVFRDLFDDGQHVVYVDFGVSSSTDFIDESSLSSSGAESGFIIPFLSETPDGPPELSIAMAEFYSRDRGEPAKPNIIYPFMSIDEMRVEDGEAFWKSGDEELLVSFVKSNPCQIPSVVTKEVFAKFFTGLKVLGWSEPDLGMCHRYPADNEYCSVMNAIENDVEEALPDVCQTYNISEVVECAASFDVIKVTPGFREFLLIGDDPIKIIASERFYCNATTTFLFPCEG